MQGKSKGIKVTGIIIFFVSILLLFSFASPIFAANLPSGKKLPTVKEKNTPEFISGQVIVKFKSDKSVESLRAPSSFKMTAWKRGSFGFIQMFIEGDVKKACAELMKDPSISIAEPNYVRYLMAIPNDPLFSTQNNLKLSKAELGWNIETGDADIIVAVIDTGVDKVHPDLAPNLIPGKNLIDTGKDESDDSGHGTAVSGVVGAVGNNSTGVCGSAWHISILPLRACGGPGLTCDIMNEVEAIDEAIAEGADIINLSLGGWFKSSFEEIAINEAWNAGITIFAAAGNQGNLGKFGTDTEDLINYPAGLEHVCGVSSVDYPLNGDISKIKLSSFSNSGDAVSVTAVGSSVITTAPSVTVPYLIFNQQADYGRIDGTSFSTPLVSGLAAIIKSHFPNLTNDELRHRIETSVLDIGPAGWDDQFGYGLVDFSKALTASTHASNEAFNLGVTTSPILPDEVLVVAKVKKPITGKPTLTYTYFEGGSLKSGSIPLRLVPNNPNIWSGRLHIIFSGSITFKVNGTASGGGALTELTAQYFKGKS